MKRILEAESSSTSTLAEVVEAIDKLSRLLLEFPDPLTAEYIEQVSEAASVVVRIVYGLKHPTKETTLLERIALHGACDVAVEATLLQSSLNRMGDQFQSAFWPPQERFFLKAKGFAMLASEL